VGHDHDHATSAQDENDDQLTHDSNTLWISKSATRSRGPSAVALGCSSESKCNPPVVSSARLPPSQGRPLELGQRPLESQRRSTIDEPTPIEALSLETPLQKHCFRGTALGRIVLGPAPGTVTGQPHPTTRPQSSPRGGGVSPLNAAT
jgi:hypothetical protein